jgi:hypothetical protein
MIGRAPDPEQVDEEERERQTRRDVTQRAHVCPHCNKDEPVGALLHNTHEPCEECNTPEAGISHLEALVETVKGLCYTTDT